MTRAETAASIALWLVVLGAAAGALGALAASLVPYEPLKASLDRWSVDGDAAAFTRAAHAAIAWKLRLAAGALGLCAAGLLALRGRLTPALARAASAAAALAGVAAAGTALGWRDTPRASRLALVLICLLGLALRLAFIDQPIRYDEAFTYSRYASQPAYFFLASYSHPNNHLFHTLLVHLSTGALGGEPWAIRLPALIAGSALPLAAYVAGRAHHGSGAGLLAATLVASSSILVEYSVNGRGYTWVCLWTLVLMALAARLVRSADAAAWAAFGAVAAVGMWTVPVMVYPIGVLGLWLALSIALEPPRPEPSRAARVRGLAIAAGVTAAGTALLYAPVLLVDGPGAVIDSHAAGSVAALLVAAPPFAGELWRLWTRDWPAAAGVLLLAGTLLSPVLCAGGRFRVPLLPVAALAIGALLCIKPALGYTRVWLFALPPLLVLSAGSWARVAGRAAPRLAGATASAIACTAIAALLGATVARSDGIARSEETGTLRDAEAIARLLEARLRPGDRIAPSPARAAPLVYHLDRLGVPRSHLDLGGSPTRLFVVKATAEPLARVLEQQGLPVARIDARLLASFPEAEVVLARLDRAPAPACCDGP